ncbi:hypothetical protein, partial [Saccharibacter floricola]|uniref:hypothetical protein n=1 Tax=Saccharibacter floricola TaxID=231053 RepID=UPI00222F26F6
KLWFLASTDALSAETNRAQAAEAQAVSGTYGLIAGTHRAKAMIEGTDGNMAVCVDHGGDVWKYLPTVEALNAESQRAQSAEAALQPKGNYVVGDGNVPSDTPVQEMCIGIN